MTCIEIT